MCSSPRQGQVEGDGLTMSISYLNGSWQPIDEAKVSVLDRGFLFGDGVYEVVPVYGKNPFTLSRHLVRLNNSLDEIRLVNPLSTDQWTQLITEAIDRGGESNAALYLQITRGAGSKRDFVYPEVVQPTIFLMVSPAPALDRQNVVPHKMITLQDYRWSMGHIKTVSLIAAGLLKNEAISKGANDAILVRDGVITESTSSNVFIVVDGTLVTAPKSNLLLHGITRDVIIELARQNGLVVDERTFTPEELGKADEVFVSSSTQESWPVGSVNGKVIGNGQGGIVWQEIDRLFQEFKKTQP